MRQNGGMLHDFVSPTPLPVLAAAGSEIEAVATIIQAVATIVALAGVAITFVYAARSEKRDLEKAREESRRAEAENRLAREEARRSEASAERAENAAALSIDALEKIARGIESLADARSGAASLLPLESQRVRWTLDHFQGDTYILTNVGSLTARDVQVTADPTLMTPGELPMAQDMRPDDSVTFMAVATFGTRDKTITVEWSDEDGERESWRYPLPPRPDRR